MKTQVKIVSDDGPSEQILRRKVRLVNKVVTEKTKLSHDESLKVLSYCIKLGAKRAERARDKDVVIILGNTGAGESRGCCLKLWQWAVP